MLTETFSHTLSDWILLLFQQILSAYYVPACVRYWRHRWKITCFLLSWCLSSHEVGNDILMLPMRKWAPWGVDAVSDPASVYVGP